MAADPRVGRNLKWIEDAASERFRVFGSGLWEECRESYHRDIRPYAFPRIAAPPSPSVARGDRDAGSFYAAACDGAVRPVDSSIDPLVWERLGHRADFQIVEWPR